MTTNPGELVGDIAHIISLPDIYFRVSRLIDDPNCTSARLAEVIAYDPGLTARLLKMANASYYGRTQTVETVVHAITLIGTSDLQHLVLVTSASQAFRKLKTNIIDMDAFWQHSVCCALAARALASECQPRHRERNFVSGLLHDVGQLLICYQLPDVAEKIERHLLAHPEAKRYFVEQEELGFTHAEVGAELLRFWKLPDSLCDAVEFHHDPMASKNYPMDASLVHISDALAHRMDLQAKTLSDSDTINTMDPKAWALCNLDEKALESVAAEVHAQWFEVFEVIWPGGGQIY